MLVAKHFEDYIDKNGIYQGPEIWTGHVCVSEVKSLGTLKEIYGTLRVQHSSAFCDLGNLEQAHACVYLSGNPKLLTLGSLKRVDRNLDVSGCGNLRDLGMLAYVGGYANLSNTSLTSLGKLIEISGPLDVRNLSLTSFEPVKHIGRVLTVSRGTYVPPTLRVPKVSIEGKVQSSLLYYAGVSEMVKKTPLATLILKKCQENLDEVHLSLIEKKIKSG